MYIRHRSDIAVTVGLISAYMIRRGRQANFQGQPAVVDAVVRIFLEGVLAPHVDPHSKQSDALQA